VEVLRDSIDNQTTTMTHASPLQFPDTADRVFREAQRFRRQTPSERFLAILDLVASGERLLQGSPRREQAQALRAADELEWRTAHRKLFSKHGF
jgi:hypothetical protein